MKAILIATDFSAAAKNAADYAALLARQLGATLYLQHSYMLPTPISEMPVVLVNAEELQRDNEKAVADEARRLQQEHDIAVDTITTIGIATEELLLTIEEKTPDLLIMGMKGAGNALDRLVGSTVLVMARKSPIPVLAVPLTARYAPIQQVGLATDYRTDFPFKTLHTLLQLAKQSQAKIHFVHVQKPGTELNSDAIHGKKALENLFEHLPHEWHEIENPIVEEGIKAFTAAVPVQIMAMVAHHHNFFERLFGTVHTREMMYDSELPLLVLPEKQ
jgi:nucleotide-binding universal stress UspA family protein